MERTRACPRKMTGTSSPTCSRSRSPSACRARPRRPRRLVARRDTIRLTERAAATTRTRTWGYCRSERCRRAHPPRPRSPDVAVERSSRPGAPLDNRNQTSGDGVAGRDFPGRCRAHLDRTSASTPCCDLREELVEDAPERVREHERPGHERDAEYHRDPREDEAKLLGHQPRDRDPPHGKKVLAIIAKALHAVEHAGGGGKALRKSFLLMIPFHLRK